MIVLQWDPLRYYRNFKMNFSNENYWDFVLFNMYIVLGIINFLHLLCVCDCVYKTECICVLVLLCICESQRATCGNWVSPSTMWVLTIKLRSSDLVAMAFTLPNPVLTIFLWGVGGSRQDRVSLCSSSHPGIHSIDQAGFKFRDSSSTSWVLGLKARATTPNLVLTF